MSVKAETGDQIIPEAMKESTERAGDSIMPQEDSDIQADGNGHTLVIAGDDQNNSSGEKESQPFE